MKEFKWTKRFMNLKDKFAFQLQAYEISLDTLKIKYRQEIEQLSMALNDFESKQMHFSKNDIQINEMLNFDINNLNLPEAVAMIKKL